jgi:1-acyl-sn-glycerol-3-phosphate acyltransferase
MLNSLFRFAFWAWILPLSILPFAITHRLFSKQTNYWKLIIDGVIRSLDIKTMYIIDKTFILANHRTICDFFMDPILSESTVVSRHVATMYVLPMSILAFFDGRMISINRKKSRSEIFRIIANHINQNRQYSKRILFFPEGTRRSHLRLDSVEETKNMLKPGLLKSIYEYKQMPVQIQITKNKELVVNEREFIMRSGITLYTSNSRPIYPEDFPTFDDFYYEICKVWFEQFNLTMV